MKPIARLATLAAALSASASVFAAAVVGQPAPAFSAVDTAGKTVSLADFKGKTLVLEWVNPGCPYVRKHYDSANMPATQTDAVAKGAVWLAINSTHTGASDYMAPGHRRVLAAARSARPVLLGNPLMRRRALIGASQLRGAAKPGGVELHRPGMHPPSASRSRICEEAR